LGGAKNEKQAVGLGKVQIGVEKWNAEKRQPASQISWGKKETKTWGEKALELDFGGRTCSGVGG